MKKKLSAVLIGIVLLILVTAGGRYILAESKDEGKKLVLGNVGYSTITEGFDWGPAITKVVLNMKTAMDGSTLSKSMFEVSSVREYASFNIATMEYEEKKKIEKRTVTRAYISDAMGKEEAGGSYLTLQMEVGPDITAGSPIHYDFKTGQNQYVNTRYSIALDGEGKLKEADGRLLYMNTTDQSGYQGNSNLLADEFDKSGLYTWNGITLRYAFYKPAAVSTKKGSNPLIIWLHGAGEGGEDPTIVLLGNKVVNLSSQEIQQYFGATGAYVLVPQCKTMWMDYDGSARYNNEVSDSNGKSYYTEALKGLIDEFVGKISSIDKKRIYIGGCSNGGYMTMNMITSYSDYFAAAFPVCEAYSDSWLSDQAVNRIKNIPIWFTHAKTDETVPIFKGEVDNTTDRYKLTLNSKGKAIAINDYSNAAYQRLIKAGAKNVHYSLFDNVIDRTGSYFKAGTKEPYEYKGHWSWIYALNNQCTDIIDGKETSLFEWLGNQSK